MENIIQDAEEDTIAKPVELPEFTFRIAVEPRTYYHIGLFLIYGSKQCMNCGGAVGRISVHYDVDIGIHTLKHRLNDVPLALASFSHDDSAGSARFLKRSICRIVIENVDRRTR